MPRRAVPVGDPTKKHRPLSLLLTDSDMAVVLEYAGQLSISKAAAARLLIRAGAKVLDLDNTPDEDRPTDY